MRQIVSYLDRGGPVVGLRTAPGRSPLGATKARDSASG
jgi:hypothetical protein